MSQEIRAKWSGFFLAIPTIFWLGVFFILHLLILALYAYPHVKTTKVPN